MFCDKACKNYYLQSSLKRLQEASNVKEATNIINDAKLDVVLNIAGTLQVIKTTDDITRLAFFLQNRPVRFVTNFFWPFVILSSIGDEFVFFETLLTFPLNKIIEEFRHYKDKCLIDRVIHELQDDTNIAM